MLSYSDSFNLKAKRSINNFPDKMNPRRFIWRNSISSSWVLVSFPLQLCFAMCVCVCVCVCVITYTMCVTSYRELAVGLGSVPSMQTQEWFHVLHNRQIPLGMFFTGEYKKNPLEVSCRYFLLTEVCWQKVPWFSWLKKWRKKPKVKSSRISVLFTLGKIYL